MSLAFMFPGQGAQHPGMLRAIGETGAATTVLADAKAICADLGLPADLDSAAALSDTVATQVSLVIVGVACARGMSRDHGLFPRFVAGHSAGAFAATVVAGVLTLREALTAVKLRGESMRAACARGEWGMAAIRGLPTRAVQQLTIQVGTSRDPLWVANINTATQTVLGGTTAALAAARDAAREAGATGFDLLDIAVASHGQVQDETARTLRAHLAAVPLRDPTARYLTNTGGRSVRSADAVIDDLADSAARPVRWYDGVRLMAELGVTCALELPPGHTLTRTVATIAPHITTLAVSDVGARAAASRAGRCARTSIA
jgi:malonate decarboxylase epsilon subunit